MGGKALKNIKTRRYDKYEYINISNEILNNLSLLFPKIKICSVPYLNDKETFGDLDILISDSFGINNMIPKILNLFKPIEHIKNGNVFTFNVNDFQIDLIFVNDINFDMSICYFQNNDAGMLIGKICHSLGLKYGPTGLRLLVLNENDRLCDIQLTNDPRLIFSILGLDFDTFNRGFDNYTQLFDFLSTSKYFYYDIFDSSLINSASRRRDNKRNSLHLFFEYLTLNQERLSHSERKRTQDENIDFIDKLFPNKFVYRTIDEANKKLANKKLASEKWNGNIIMKLFPELTNNKLGSSIIKHKEFVKSFDLDFEYYILNNDFDKILNDFKLINEL